MSFSWVPFYREVAERVLQYEDKQDELLALLREMKAAGLPTVPLEHNQPTLTPLTTIDPFTFMANFGRNLETSNSAICQWMREKWQLKTPTPTDFSGRHGVQANYRGSWFFGSLAERIPNDTDALWRLAKQAYDGDVDSLDGALVAQCLSWPNLQMKKLSMGLSWLNPEAFLPLSGRLLDYAKSLGIAFQKSALLAGDLDEYRVFLDAVEQIEPNYPAFVKAAYQNQPDDEFEKDEVTAMLNFPLNQILYGPPGTGKTYSTIERAVEIIDGAPASSHVAAKARFDELRKNGQIEFVTFHQSFSYEEFIEGLRPILDEDGDGTARYEVRAGVLKTLALRAIASALEKQDIKRATFDQLWNQLLEKIDDGDWTLPGLGTSKFKLTVTSAGNLTGSNIAGKAETRFSASRAKVEKVWEALRDEPNVTHATITQVLKVGAHTNLIGAVVEEIKRLAKQPQLFTAPQVESSSEAAQSFLNNSPDYRAQFSNPLSYVLIVDEINRGNISKILGELITLLEPDKRIGAANELRVQLPVSGETFALPPNLYLLGTMNTADKSLALLDVALRRRFDFIEMAPDSSLFPDCARDVLIQLNLRLEAALDREHRIGHAYFIECKNETQFNAVFRTKIVPLLQEFFYNDWETLRAVLGESDENGAFVKKLVAPSGMKARTKWRWWFDDDGANNLDILAALRANYS